MLDGQGYDISCDLVMKVSVGGQARALTPTPTTYLLIALAALISVCRCMRAGVCMVVVCLLIGARINKHTTTYMNP